MAPKRQQFSVETKYKALCEIDKGAKKTYVAEKLRIPPNTLSTWIKNQNKIKEAYESGECSSKAKKIRAADNPDVEKAINTWITDARAQNIPLSGEIVRRQASRFADRFGKCDFKASRGWFARYKKRRGFCFRKIRGESRSVTPQMTEKWFEHELPRILEAYPPEDVYNMDETSLFFKAPADRSLVLPGDSASGIKVSKERVILALCVNMNGSDKRQPVIIGRSRRPRCFRKIEKMPVAYYSNQRAWMTSKNFEDWCSKWNRKLTIQHRNIVLVIDNCPSHPHLELSNIRLVFLPPGTSSETQPLDQGIIANFKSKYRTKMTDDHLDSLENNVPWTWTLENALYATLRAWKDVKVSTIVNCFRHCQFIPSSSTHDDDDEEEEEEEEEDEQSLVRLAGRLKATGSILTEEEVEDYLFANDDVPCHAQLSEDEIVAQVSEKDDEKEIDSDDSLHIQNVSLEDALTACNTIKQHIIQSTIYCDSDEKTLTLLREMNFLLLRRGSSHLMKQSTLDAFLTR